MPVDFAVTWSNNYDKLKILSMTPMVASSTLLAFQAPRFGERPTISCKRWAIVDLDRFQKVKLIQMKSQKQSYIHCFILASLVFPIPKDSGWKQSKIKCVCVGRGLLILPPISLDQRYSRIRPVTVEFLTCLPKLKMVKDVWPAQWYNIIK